MTNSWNIDFRPGVKKDLKKIPSTLIPQIFTAIEELSTNPFPTGYVKLTDTDA
jgi:hypothetical protein